MRKRHPAGKKAQLTILLIVAIILVLIIALFFLMNGSFFKSKVPREMRPAYDSYLDCLESHAKDGVYLLGSQGGYIDVPDFVPGSRYRPFSSQLDFMGRPIPYWMYLSGNNLIKEQVPTKADMSRELESYIQKRLDFCTLDEYESQGFGFYIENGDVDVRIKDDLVMIIANNPLNIYHKNESVRVDDHEIELDVRLGAIYDQAKELYNYEKTDMFLEKYSLDVLRLYAPVDGVEIGCKPLVFNDNKIKQNLTQGLSANINSLKVKGSYYELNDKDNDYFVVEPGFETDSNVNFLYDSRWPSRVEIFGEKTPQPVGMQEGLSFLGFCYVPYHLVYDINFPVLIQFWEGDFFFQFPVSVVIDKNYAREALAPMEGHDVSIEGEVCKHKNQDITVYTYDTDYKPIPARLQFKCLDEICEIGETELKKSGSYYEGKVPECINAFLIASSPGYATKKYKVSTNEDTVVDITLKKIYSIDLDLGDIDGTAVINFDSEEHSQTVLYPEQKSVGLIDNMYNVTVHVYKNTSITLEGKDESVCVDVPVEGAGNLLGITKEKCNDINIPEMQIDSALIGGGRSNEYVFSDVLQDASEMNINVALFKNPKTIKDLQLNFQRAEDEPLRIGYE